MHEKKVGYYIIWYNIWEAECLNGSFNYFILIVQISEIFGFTFDLTSLFIVFTKAQPNPFILRYSPNYGNISVEIIKYVKTAFV